MGGRRVRFNVRDLVFCLSSITSGVEFQLFSYIHYWVEYLYLLDIFVYNKIDL